MKTTAPNPSTPEATRPVAHISSVPDREFERPTTITEIRELAFLGTEILHSAMLHLLFGRVDCEVVGILHKAQLEASAAHEFICEVKFVGIPEWQKAGAA